MKVKDVINRLKDFPPDSKCVATWEGITVDFREKFFYAIDDFVLVDVDQYPDSSDSYKKRHISEGFYYNGEEEVDEQ